MALLNIEHVSKSFDGEEIIRDTSLSVEAGRAVGFVSPSGSGKSTMLSMAGLLLTPDTGKISTEDGRNALELDDRELSRLRNRLIGFVFQSTQLVGSLRAIENVMAPTYFAGKLDFDAEGRARELLERFGMGERVDYYPHQLSVGQKRRIAVARAMILRPRVIIADEPTNDLDAESAGLVTDALFEYAAQGNALLFATHSEALAGRADTLMRLVDKSFVAENDND